MGLFFDVLSAINNPNQQASVSQLESITNSIQQVASSQGFDAAKTQSVLSALGSVLRPTLAQQQGVMGSNQLEDLLGRVGAGTNTAAMSSLFPPQIQQQLIQGVAQKTGISPNLLQSMLPTLIPAVLGLLGMGASKPGAPGGNPLLTAFLNGDRDGNTNLGDVFKFASRFLSPAQV
ncbi:DUF937 domain-containing protein [Microcoleus sp. FACHB-1515]|uniref:DUF937 domain-containing protein n=1 Tax=Cyanophyceae TaxID=3028117 RepID=UPI0016870F0F|nr:DUF937 domain-containing protein [Microcoleus sp. FACHB-1515]MBD2089119.1 DUF937 domain-containing protein [Microcoleus sp. FACHB-1515]